MTTETPTPQDIAITLAFLMEGFDDAQRMDGGKWDYHCDAHGGKIGIVSNMYPYAVWIETELLCHTLGTWPGAFHYEVTNLLGWWMYTTPEAFDAGEPSKLFIDVAIERIGDWFKQGEGR